ncbi:hypothetical protein [Lactobacillus mulieris]|uniref:hypothetical protein n=1 Tax=Lactobacillus mulieris TaxID=2508708 RepID=UPI0022AC5647|nr:hypothetical protein [Lactobacillus mulieris]MCZ3742195.1 hypothetical protein [Lactobacillus mulieris]MCZ3749033.1 hypothetical protein [Lactobacillus mulieris]MCZ3750662.1 hypothetical protein [Lactobacillus mulieris]MDT9629391.1 hypothetical protein [Lactobacillus mulieris]
MLSEKIRIYRTSKNLTQKEATEQFNKFLESNKYIDKKENILKPISFKTWARWENNNKVPAKFFKALGAFCGLSDEECVNTGYSFSKLWDILEAEYIRGLHKEEEGYITNADIEQGLALAAKKFNKEKNINEFIDFMSDYLPIDIDDQVEKGKISASSAYLNIKFFEAVDEYINAVHPRLYSKEDTEEFIDLSAETKINNLIHTFFAKPFLNDGVLVTTYFESFLSFIFNDASFKRLLNTAEKYSNDEIIHLATLAITYRTSAILKNASKLEPYRDDEGALTDDFGQLTIDY